MIEQLFKASVQRLRGYSSPPQPAVAAKLNQNESPYDLPESIREAALEKFRSLEWRRYPVNESPDLCHRLAAWHGVGQEQVILGNGSNQLLQTLLNASLEKGDKVLYCPPTFGLFEIFTRASDALPLAILHPPGSEAPREAILRVLPIEKPKLILLCSPNNPTGGEYSLDLVREICANAPGLVLIDEAYGEFSTQSVMTLLSDYPNLIISRTFSKAFSMAGLRLGYFIANPEVIRQLAKVNLPYNINLFTEVLADLVLDHRHELLRRIEGIIAERERLYLAMKAIPGLRVYPSAANFLLFATANGGQLFTDLFKKGVLLRDVSSYPLLENHLRVTVGTCEENNCFLKALHQSLKQ